MRKEFELSEWLDKVPGRTKEMASHFNVTMGAVSQWRDMPPTNKLLEISRFTKEQVTVTSMLKTRQRKRQGATA